MSLSELINNKVYSSSIDSIQLPAGVINTINAHSYCLTTKDDNFKTALIESDILLPDGVSIVMAAKWLHGKKINKIAGADIHEYLLEYAHNNRQKVFYLGSTNETLNNIIKNVSIKYPQILLNSFSPPYKSEFTNEDSKNMINKINTFNPDVLFIGMTAPKQEKWLHQNRHLMQVKTITCIGAVFDFYAGTIQRAPQWMIDFHLEWLFRLIKEPRRMWKRYLIHNSVFIYYLLREKIL